MRKLGALLSLALSVACASVPDQPNMSKQEQLQQFYEADPTFKDFISKSYGYAVFPLVGKGGYVVGGAYGKGWVYEQGRFIGGYRF